MISIFRRRRESGGLADGRNGKIRAPEQFSPIPCLDGLVWIEDGCLHKSGMDTSQSFRLPLTDVSDIVADWDFFKENPTRAETRIMVQGPAGLVRASFGPLQYWGMISLTAHLHHVYTEEQTTELGETAGEAPEMVGPFECRRGMMWADRDFVYLGKSVSADSARVPHVHHRRRQGPLGPVRGQQRASHPPGRIQPPGGPDGIGVSGKAGFRRLRPGELREPTAHRPAGMIAPTRRNDRADPPE